MSLSREQRDIIIYKKAKIGKLFHIPNQITLYSEPRFGCENVMLDIPYDKESNILLGTPKEKLQLYHTFQNLLEYEFTIKPEPQYRPFKDAKEFEPFRDRWVVQKMFKDVVRQVTGYDNSYVYVNGAETTWLDIFNKFTFDDGTPFGIEVQDEN